MFPVECRAISTWRPSRSLFLELFLEGEEEGHDKEECGSGQPMYMVSIVSVLCERRKEKPGVGGQVEEGRIGGTREEEEE